MIYTEVYAYVNSRGDSHKVEHCSRLATASCLAQALTVTVDLLKQLYSKLSVISEVLQSVLKRFVLELQSFCICIKPPPAIITRAILVWACRERESACVCS